MKRVIALLAIIGLAFFMFAAPTFADHKEGHNPPGQEKPDNPGKPENPGGGQEKVTLCHAAGLAGTTKYVTITVGYPAAFGPAGHFDENGTPLAGHEQDYLGACVTDTPTEEPSVDPSETPTVEPSEEPTVAPTETVDPEPSVRPEKPRGNKPVPEVTVPPEGPRKAVGAPVAAPVEVPTAVAAGLASAEVESDGINLGRTAIVLIILAVVVFAVYLYTRRSKGDHIA
jgi:hypothetical protein